MFGPVQIDIKGMKVNNADHAGFISFGRTVLTNRNVAAKKTQGFGQQFADGVVRLCTVQYVQDDEVEDFRSVKENRI
ncbi:hypothetical protein [Cohnella candidum]|nr:hypothetical protein [Cohnella candidum]